MLGKSVMKVPGGKLLKAAVEHDGDRIISVKFSGDFFMHPEDALESLEESLAGVRVSEVRGVVERELSGARLYGVDANSIVKAVWGAMG